MIIILLNKNNKNRNNCEKLHCLDITFYKVTSIINNNNE